MEQEMRQFAALHLQTQYPVVLLSDNSKKLEFKNPKPFTRVEIQHWMRRSLFNIGILLQGIMAVDCDAEGAREWVEQHWAKSPMVARTARGFHLYFRSLLGSQKTLIKFREGIDLKFTGHMVAPPSVVDGWRYEWENGIVKPESLPEFKSEWLPLESKKEVKLPVARKPQQRGHIRNPERYCLNISSIQGQRGSAALVRVVSILRDAGWSPMRVWDFLLRWNIKCADPPWSEKELLHALTRHMGDSTNASPIARV